MIIFRAEVIAAILKANIGKWASNGKNLTLNDIDRLMADHRIQGADAAAVTVLKGFVLGKYGKHLAANANLFIKGLDVNNPAGWDPEHQGLTVADIDYYNSNFQPPSKLRNAVGKLEDRYERYVLNIRSKPVNLFAVGGPDWASVSQGALGDCAFLAAVSSQVAAENGRGPFQSGVRPSFTSRIVAQPAKGGIKQYLVKFGNIHDGARKKEVKNLTKEVNVAEPTDAEYALYASAGKNGLWLSVYEKAYALQFKPTFGRLDAIYDGIHDGQPLEVPILLLTGHKAKVYSLGGNPGANADKASTVQKAMQAAITNHRIITTDLLDSSDIGAALGLPRNSAHAFSAFDVAPSRLGETPAVSLQNPWNMPGRFGATNFGGRFKWNFDKFYKSFRFVAIETPNN